MGLMSGTSADAVDAALVQWPQSAAARPFQLRAYVELPLGAALQARVHALAAGRAAAADALAELAALDVQLGARFAEAAHACAARAGVPLTHVAAVASHGQTLAHHPQRHASLQVGCPSVIAERCGAPVVADFRARDLAAGGCGAPLAPFFHHALLGAAAEDRVVLNLGGMANLTWLPRGAAPADVIAFDTGPANALLDGVAAKASAGRARFDAGGAQALQGEVQAPLLAELLADEFLHQAPPKSTGRERYGLAQAEALAAQVPRNISLQNMLATLCAFSAEAAALAIRTWLPPQARAARIIVCGGGVHNKALMRELAARTNAPVTVSDELGVPAAAVEAMAFSLMGRNHLLGLPNHLPQCTGARGARVLGESAPAHSRTTAALR